MIQRNASLLNQKKHSNEQTRNNKIKSSSGIIIKAFTVHCNKQDQNKQKIRKKLTVLAGQSIEQLFACTGLQKCSHLHFHKNQPLFQSKLLLVRYFVQTHTTQQFPANTKKFNLIMIHSRQFLLESPKKALSNGKKIPSNKNNNKLYTFKYLAAIESLPISQKIFTALSKQDTASALKRYKKNLNIENSIKQWHALYNLITGKEHAREHTQK